MPNLVTSSDFLPAHMPPASPAVPPLAAESEALRLSTSYADMLTATGGIADPALARSIKDHLVVLAALALAADRDASDVARQHGPRAERLKDVLSAIKAGYCDPSFSLRAVAQKQRVSERYLRALLNKTGIGFTERVLEFRLQHAYALLTRSRHRHRKVNDIAFSVGFNDLSYFNRSFRARYGMTPGAARAMAADNGETTAPL